MGTIDFSFLPGNKSRPKTKCNLTFIPGFFSSINFFIPYGNIFLEEEKNWWGGRDPHLTDRAAASEAAAAISASRAANAASSASLFFSPAAALTSRSRAFMRAFLSACTTKHGGGAAAAAQHYCPQPHNTSGSSSSGGGKCLRVVWGHMQQGSQNPWPGTGHTCKEVQAQKGQHGYGNGVMKIWSVRACQKQHQPRRHQVREVPSHACNLMQPDAAIKNTPFLLPAPPPSRRSRGWAPPQCQSPTGLAERP